MTIGLVIKGMFRVSTVDDGTPLLYDAHDYTSLLKLKGSTFGEIFSEAIHKKETLLSSNVDKGHYSVTLTSQNDFHHLNIFPMSNFSRELGKILGH